MATSHFSGRCTHALSLLVKWIGTGQMRSEWTYLHPGVDRGCALQVCIFSSLWFDVRFAAMSLNVQLFGPVVVRVDGAIVPLGGRIPRAIVARLALSSGHRLPAGELIEALWVSPPPSAIASLRAHISRLRNLLGEQLAGGRGGYALLGVDSVDVHAFTSAAEAGIRDRSLGVLETAERLWTGKLFDDLTGIPFVAEWAEKLKAQHRIGAELLGRLRLEAGDYLGAIATLQPLVNENCAHDQPVILLARAQSRAGRTGDALATIDTYRRRTAEEFGLDLPPELAELRSDVVRHSSSVAAAQLGRSEIERHGLPLPLTGFVGRRHELEAIEVARSRARLVTLTGSGGVGKTRLAVESTRRIRDVVDDAQWMLEMAPLTGERELISALAQLLRVPVPSMEAISDRLSDGRNLLVLDNAEHVRAAVTALCQELLARCSGLAIMVTSREPLCIAGERVISIDPMLGDSLGDAVELFICRGDDARPGFRDPSDIARIRNLCTLLDGLPLAIELAAARLSVQSMSEILHSIHERPGESWSFASTTTRHHSMRSTVEWSVDLLGSPERDLLAQIGRFQGPVTAEAVAGICRVPDGCSVQDLVASLVQKSLLAVETSSQGTRAFKLLESTKSFARSLSIAEEESWYNRHREWFAAAVHSLAPQMFSHAAPVAHDIVEVMRPDLLRALDGAITSEQGYDALRLAGGQGWHWVRRGVLTEGRQWLDRALLSAKDDHGRAIDGERARVLHAGCVLSYMSGDIANARRYAVDCSSYATIADDRNLTAVSLGFMSYWEALFGDLQEAKILMDSAFERASDAEPWARSEIFVTCGQAQRSLGHPARALETLSEAERLARHCGHGWALIPAVGIASKILIDLGRGSDAISRLAPLAARAFADNDPTSTMATLHQSIGAAALIEKHYEGAVLHSVVGRLGKAYNFDPLVTEPEDSARYLERIRQCLSADQWRQAQIAGRNMSLNSAVSMLGSLVT